MSLDSVTDGDAEKSREQLLSSLKSFRARVSELEQEKLDLELMLETSAEHADDVSDALVSERDDLAEEKTKSDEMASLLRRMFGRYVASEVVEAMLENPAGLELGGEKRSVTIMMTDLRGFTALSERLAPEQVVQMLNTYFEVMIEIIDRHQGMVNEIIGDALLVLFGAPQPMPDRARRAVACAIEMQNGMAAVNASNRAAGLPELEMGIGLNDAEVVVGNVGSAQRSKYAAVGSGVNLASRIESFTVGGQILASESVLKEAGDVLRIDDQRQIFPKGATAPLWVYAVGGIGGEFNLALVEADATLLRLAHRVPVRFEPVEGKAAGGALLNGAIVRLSRTSIDIETPASLAPMSDLRFNLQEVNEALAVRDFYGKVVQTGHLQSSVRVRITALPPEVSAYFEALRGYATPQGLAERRRFARGFPAMDVVEDNAEDTF